MLHRFPAFLRGRDAATTRAIGLLRFLHGLQTGRVTAQGSLLISPGACFQAKVAGLEFGATAHAADARAWFTARPLLVDLLAVDDHAFGFDAEFDLAAMDFRDFDFHAAAADHDGLA